MTRHVLMNRTHLVCNPELNTTDVANTKGRGQSTLRRKLIVTALALAFAPLAYAAPTGGQVGAGQGSINQAGTTTTINQSSQNLAINWQSFGIGANEAVNFVQPSASAIVLNRVLGQNPSQILGNLNANGQVFILNPNGVLFGTGSQVNVGGLIASTLNLSDADFIAGKFSFQNPSPLAGEGQGSGAVVNQGTLTAAQGGYIALLAPEVRNEGVISATLGTALLAAGDKVTLNLNNGSLLSFSIDQGSLNALAENKQLIQADGGQVYMSAQAANSLATAVVNNTGIIQAHTVQNVAGTIRLIGDMQVGTVNVGGTLDASALSLPPSPLTLSASNGGFIETSAAHVKVADSAHIITTAVANGLSGTWLIDPTDYTIAASDPGNGSSYMSNATLVSSLNSGNVTIQTLSSGTGNGDIFVNGAVSWSSANSLTLNAIRNVNINAAISNTSGGNLVVRADLNGSSVGTILFGGSGSVALIGGMMGGHADLYYNPVSYAMPTDYSANMGTTPYTAWMLVNDVGQATGGTLGLQAMNTNLAGNYALGRNIDAVTTFNWNLGLGFTPVGDSNTFYTGIFDGLGHTICNLTINRPTTDYVGLFGYADTGTIIRNVGLVGGNVSGLNNVGALVGWNAGGTISNSYVTGSVIGAANFVGGLVGFNNYGTISNSYTTDSVTGGGSSGAVGGLAGYNWGGTVSDSYATGNVIGASGSVGGLLGGSAGIGTVSNSFATGSVNGTGSVGGLIGDNHGTVSNSYATGSVSGSAIGIGGLLGFNSGMVSNSYATGGVTGGTESVGGLVGLNSNGTVSYSYATGSVTGGVGSVYVGGLVGYNSNNSIGMVSNSYATGSVSGSNFVGGLVGYNEWDGIVSNGYWNIDINTTGIGFNNGGTITGGGGLTIAQMHTASNFVGFTFTSTPGLSGNNWVIVDTNGTLNNAVGAAGDTYPMLASEYSTTIYSAHQLQLVQMDLAASYTLGANINAATTGLATDVWGSAGFVPISVFTGTFDGLGHVISNFTINRSAVNLVGLFGDTLGSIQNVGLFGGSVSGSWYVGGLVGRNRGTVSNSYSTGLVSGVDQVGGLVGLIHVSGTVNNSYATGSVSGTNRVGGLVGASVGIVSNSYATGSVSGTSKVGELVGGNYGTVSNSFWDKTVNPTGFGFSMGATLTGPVIGMTTADMQQQLNFTSITAANGNTTNPGWNFSDTWVMYDGHTAPLLRVFMTPLTVTASSDSKVYDGLPYYGGTASYLCCAPNANLLGAVDFSNSPSEGANNVGTYAMTPGGLYSNQQGYIISYVSGMLTVTPADLSLSGTRAYDGTTVFAGSNLIATGVNGETFTMGGVGASGNLGTNKNVQTNQLLTNVTGLILGASGNGGLSTNYNAIATTGSSVNVTAANLTLSAVTDTKLYNGTTNSSGAVGISGLFSPDSVSGATQSYASQNVLGTNGSTLNVNSSYTVNDGNGGLNYTVITNSATGTITPETLTYTANTANRLYGGIDPAFSGSVTGFVPNENLGNATTGTASFGTNALSTSNVGIYAINGSGLTASNYVFVQAAGNSTAYTIKKAALTVTAIAASKTYDGQAYTGGNGVSYSGFVLGQGAGVLGGTLAYGGTAQGAVNAGGYQISSSGLTSGNYTIGYVDGALTVNKALLTVTADNQSRLYGAVNPTFSEAITGFVNNENSSVVSGTATGSSTATTGTGAGTSTINGRVGSLTASNYDFAVANGTLTITDVPPDLVIDPKPPIYTAQNPKDTPPVIGGCGLCDHLVIITDGGVKLPTTEVPPTIVLPVTPPPAPVTPSPVIVIPPPVTEIPLPEALRIAQAQKAELKRGANILFDTDKSEPKDLTFLDQMADAAINGKMTVTVIAHTDVVGSLEYNRKLSLRRATRVRELLIARGVDARRVVIVGEGKGAPAADNRTVEGRALNRRAVIKGLETDDKH